MTWGLTATAAGVIASSFAFVNLVARPIGGLVSDRFGNRRFVMLAYMLGIAIGFVLMGLMGSNWPLFIAVAVTICAQFLCKVQKVQPLASFRPLSVVLLGKSPVWRGLTHVGAVFYLTCTPS